MDEWVTQKRLNLEKVQLPKVEDKKKSSAASSAASKSKSKQNPSKSKQNNSSQSQPVSSSQPSSSQQSESQPVLSEVETGSSTITTTNKNKSGGLFGRKRKANDEVCSVIFKFFRTNYNMYTKIY